MNRLWKNAHRVDPQPKSGPRDCQDAEIQGQISYPAASEELVFNVRDMNVKIFSDLSA